MIKTKIIAITCILLLYNSLFINAYANEVIEKRIIAECDSLRGKNSLDCSDSFEVTFEIENIQSKSGGGISFAMYIKNIGSETMNIFNPLDYLSVLFNDESDLLTLPTYIQRHQFQRKSTEIPLVELPFEVKKMSLNDSEFNEEKMHQVSYELKSKDRISVSFEIIKVRVRKHNPDNIKELPIGKYYLQPKVSLILFPGDSLGENTYVQYHIEQQEIEYRK